MAVVVVVVVVPILLSQCTGANIQLVALGCFFIQSDLKVLLGDFDLTKPAPPEAERRKVLWQNSNFGTCCGILISWLPSWQVLHIIAHPRFDSGKFDFDFALVQIER